MVKYIRLILGISFVLSCATDALADTAVPTRTINLVYDDSGSMIRLGGEYVDTWCQAKYAMEVVAAMLGERDSLNVYYMSDYDGGTAAGPRISLRGSRDAGQVARNVELIHNTVTPFGNTPFNAVRKASADLRLATTDERWLVVLTDGEFEDGRMPGAEVEKFYRQFVADGKSRIIMLAMGPQAAKIHADEAGGIYFEHAASTADILPKLTRICNRIFQRNVLPVAQNNRNYKIQFEVPMQQLIVFSQGRDTKIGESITGPDDRKFTQSSNVHVTYSTQSSVQNPPGTVVADNLNGYVATYDGEFGPGTYNLDVTNSESIEVYYKPNVAINAYLYDLDGNEVTDSADIVNGNYKLEFGFVNAVTNERVKDTSLLGKIEYSGTITNTDTAGTPTTVEASSGDQITLREGTVDIDVTARYLDYNTVHTKLNYQVFFRNELELLLDGEPVYSLTKDGLADADRPMVVSVRMRDGDQLVALTPEQWEAMPVPRVTTPADIGEFRVEKGVNPGEFLIYPSLGETAPMEAKVGAVPFVVSGGFSRGKSSAAGRIETSFELRDDITQFERFVDWFRKYWGRTLAGFVGFILFLGWFPCKKRLPKNIKRRPFVRGVVNSGFSASQKETHCKAEYTKHLMSRFMPFCAETATVSIRNIGFCRMELKAGGGGKIIVTNKRSYLRKPEYDFGKEISENRPLTITSGATIKYKNDTTEYTFRLNTDKEN